MVGVEASGSELAGDRQSAVRLVVGDCHEIDRRVLKGGQDITVGVLAGSDVGHLQLAIVLIVVFHRSPPR